MLLRVSVLLWGAEATGSGAGTGRRNLRSKVLHLEGGDRFSWGLWWLLLVACAP